MPGFKISVSASKTQQYRDLDSQLANLIDRERDFIANAANACSLIYHALPDINWVGFYLYKADELVLGPFQGKPACVRIGIGKGVCGDAAKKRRTIIVENVHEFPGHIACDPLSRSEVVVPIIYETRLIGVLDIDSPVPGRFDREDKTGLENLIKTFVSLTECDVT